MRCQGPWLTLVLVLRSMAGCGPGEAPADKPSAPAPPVTSPATSPVTPPVMPPAVAAACTVPVDPTRRWSATIEGEELAILRGTTEIHRLRIGGGVPADVYLNPCHPYAVVSTTSDAEERAFARAEGFSLSMVADGAFVVDLAAGRSRRVPAESFPWRWFKDAAMWSPDGDHVALLETREGPILLMSTSELGPWIAGAKVAFRTIRAPDAVTSDLAWYHDLVGWSDTREGQPPSTTRPDALEFSAGCCHPPIVYRYTISTGTVTRLGFATVD